MHGERLPRLKVREMGPEDFAIRIAYFHDASDEHLEMIGVDRAALPGRAEWLEFYRHDATRPIEERETYGLIWDADGANVGFSTLGRIVFGDSAFMHLHLLRSGDRHRGLGARFVELSARHYFERLDLQRLYCEPKATNVAPNRALQRAGFTYECSHHTTPSSINFAQVTTRWVLERPA